MTGGWYKRPREIRIFMSSVMSGFFSEATMLNGCQCVCVCLCDLMKEKLMLLFIFPPSSRHLALIPRRLQGDLQNSVPAVHGCVECITGGGWHLPLSNVNITESSDSYLNKDALTSSILLVDIHTYEDVCMWLLTGQICWLKSFITCDWIVWATGHS